MRDNQRSKIYTWEWTVVAPLDGVRVPYSQAQEIVNLIWHQEGFKYPPKVRALRKNATDTGAKAVRDGNNLTILLKTRHSTRGFLVLHEIAHHLRETSRSQTEADHGPKFLGIYMKLLRRHLGIPLMRLMVRAHKYGLRYNLKAKPTVGQLERARDRRKRA